MQRPSPFWTGWKAIANVTRRFHADLRNLATLGFISDRSILGDVRSLVRDAVQNAYFEGLREGGISPDEMDDSDAANITALTETQMGYVTPFVRAIRDAKGDRAAQRDILDNRVDLWTASIAAAGQAGLNSAKANEMVTWKLGATEEHCSTCNRLNGQKHRRKWFTDHNYLPRTPGADLECGGYRCLCSLE